MPWKVAFKRQPAYHGRSLFDAPIDPEPLAQFHSATSVEAGKSMKGKTAQLRQMILRILEHQPMSDEQLVEVLEMPANTVRPRRIELYHAGLIVKGGTITAKSGRKATLWARKEDL